MKSICLVLCLNIIPFNDGAKILAIFNAQPKSHFILGTALAKGLADKGHDVTLMSPFNTTQPNPKIKHVYLEGVIDVMEGKVTKYF